MKRLLLVLLFFSLTPAMVKASSITLASDKQVYTYGDTLSIIANITNTSDAPVRMYIEHTLRDLMDRVATGFLLEVIDLEPQEAEQIELYKMKIDDRFYSGQYKVWTSLIVNKVRICEKEISFTIEGAPEDMEAVLLISQDANYTRASRVFILGEKMYMKLSEIPPDAAVYTLLKLPDNNTEQIVLPTDMTVKQEGRYTVYVNASAPGYRDLYIRAFFSVLEKSPESLSEHKEASTINLQLEKTSYTVGEEVVVMGEILPPHADVTVTITVTKDLSESIVITTTDDDGRYQATYETELSGQWSVKAGWDGDSNHESAESIQINYTVESQPRSNLLPITLAFIAILVVILVLFLRRKV